MTIESDTLNGLSFSLDRIQPVEQSLVEFTDIIPEGGNRFILRSVA